MSVRPHMRVEPPWLSLAREAWLPREDRPLRITAHMRSPVAFDREDGLRLEGPLSWLVVALTTGLPPREAFDGVGLADYVDIPLPIVDEVIHGWRIAACSDAILPDVTTEVVRRRRKKPHPEAMGISKVQTTGGPWKALDIPTAAWAAPTLTWYLRGDAERLRALLAEVHAIGRGRSGGLGHVVAWEIDEDPEALTRWRERALPAPAGEGARNAALRVPFWHRAVKGEAC